LNFELGSNVLGMIEAIDLLAKILVFIVGNGILEI